MDVIFNWNVALILRNQRAAGSDKRPIIFQSGVGAMKEKISNFTRQQRREINVSALNAAVFRGCWLSGQSATHGVGNWQPDERGRATRQTISLAADSFPEKGFSSGSSPDARSRQHSGHSLPLAR
jgi:hypothetical protein